MVIGIQISSLEAYLTTPQAVDDTLRRLKDMGCSHVQLQWIAPSVPNAAAGDALRAHGLEAKRMRLVRHHAGADASLVLIAARRGGRPGLKIEPELLLTAPDGTESAEYRRIYHR